MGVELSSVSPAMEADEDWYWALEAYVLEWRHQLALE